MTPRSHRRPSLILGARRRSVALLSAAALVAAGVPAALFMGGDSEPASAAPQYPVSLDDPVSGAEGVEKLGGRDGKDLAAVAKANNLEPDALAGLLEDDETVHVDRNGFIYVVDDFGGRTHGHAHDEPTELEPAADDSDGSDEQLVVNAGVGTGTDVGPYAPLSETFSLQSRPGAARTVFLDVDGHDLTDSYWAASRPATEQGRADAALIARQHVGWDPLGDGPAFSDAEKRLVQELWAQVAEDFSAFDVNVTTLDPGVDRLERTTINDPTFGARALISDSPELAEALAGGHNVGGGGTVGLAYVGIFNRLQSSIRNAPALTFSQKMRGWDIETIAETTSHEIGHNIGLHHSWDTRNPEPDVSQLDNSDLHHRLMDYQSAKPASFFTEPERNLAASTYGLPLRADEPGTNAATARALEAGGSARGTITAGADEDWYLLDDCTSLVARGSVADTTPNLDLALRVVDGSGATVAQDAPVTTVGTATRNNGVDATVSTTLDGSRHYLVVRSSGASGTTGRPYPASHSTGEYVLDVAGCDAGTGVPGVPRALSGTTNASGSSTLTWNAPLTSGGGFSYELKLEGRRVLTFPQGTTTHTIQTGTGPVTARIRAVNNAGASAWSEARTAAAPGTPLHVSMQPLGGNGFLLRTVFDRYSAGVIALIYTGTTGNGFYSVGTWSSYRRVGLNSADFPVGQQARLSMGDHTGTAWSGQKTFTVRANAVAPTVPTSVTATTHGDAATLKWALPADDGGEFASYRVRVDNGAWTEVDGFTFSHDFTGLSAGTHSLQVQATHVAGSSPAATVAVNVVIAGATASAPRKVEFAEVPEGVRVTWDLPLTTAGLPVTGWRVTVGGQTTVASPGRRDLVLTGFRVDRDLSVQVSAVTANGPGLTAIGTLAKR